MPILKTLVEKEKNCSLLVGSTSSGTNYQFLVPWLQWSIRIKLLEIQQWVHVSATEYRLLWLQMITISDVVLESKVVTGMFGNYGLSDAIPYCFSEATCGKFSQKIFYSTPNFIVVVP